MNIGNSKESMLCRKEEDNKYYTTKLNLTLDADNNSQATIAKSIEDGTMVLDVGCGSGALGKLLKTEKKCKLYGIDIDKEALEMAKVHYEKVYNMSVSNTKSIKYKMFINNKTKYDYIIFADLIEHVLDPGKLLYDFSKKLNEKGKILISIPNIAHWDVIIGLMKNQFNYNKTGLLDTTHIRFYTYNSFLDLISNINGKYNLNLKARLIGQTRVEPKVKQETLCNINKFFSPELLVFQNVIELSLDGINDKKKQKGNDMKVFEEILEHENQYYYLLEDNKNKEKDIETLTNQCKELIEKTTKLEEELNKYKQESEISVDKLNNNK